MQALIKGRKRADFVGTVINRHLSLVPSTTEEAILFFLYLDLRSSAVAIEQTHLQNICREIEVIHVLSVIGVNSYYHSDSDDGAM